MSLKNIIPATILAAMMATPAIASPIYAAFYCPTGTHDCMRLDESTAFATLSMYEAAMNVTHASQIQCFELDLPTWHRPGEE